MKEHEFIELLNLYLDHEITAEDAARLEAEIQLNQDRRNTYREYCRMQRACRILANEFTSTPATDRILAVRSSVTPAPTNADGSDAWQQWVLGASGLVAVASLALVAYFGMGTSSGTESMAQVRPASSGYRVVSENARSSLGQPIAVAPTVADGAGLSRSLMAEPAAASDRSLMLSFSSVPSPGLRLVSHQEDQLEWVRQFQMVSLADRNSVSLPRFEGKPHTLRPDVRAIRLGLPAETTDEFAAFRFLK